MRTYPSHDEYEASLAVYPLVETFRKSCARASWRLQWKSNELRQTKNHKYPNLLSVENIETW